MASAPASSANLGPGFDVLALALSARCHVRVDPSVEWTITSAGSDVTSETIAMLTSLLGDEPRRVDIESDIPQAAGLGSSAALLVATAMAAGMADPAEVFAAASAVEGHPDNVAAAVYGGLVSVDPVGEVRRLVIHPSWRVAVAVPAETLATSEARRVLPSQVDRDVAARTSARIVALVEGLRAGDPSLLRLAGGDELHEQPRSTLTSTPGLLIDAALGSGAAHACWSGAGPSVLAFADDGTIEDVVGALGEAAGPDGRAFETMIDREGARFE